MLALKVVAVLIGAFLLLGFGFIEPAKQAPQYQAVIILLGVAACSFAAYMAIRAVIRADRQARHAEGRPGRGTH